MSAIPLPLGQSAIVQKLYRDAQRLAPVQDAALIIGERGTGKTRLARWIHDQCRQRSGPFVKVSTPTVPPAMEYAYFAGHARGAFTGAQTEKRGFVEAAHRGTLFVDEIGLASEPVQRILLQLLDDRTVTRLGEERPRPVDVRFIAATNEDLGAAMQAGTFRRDLLDRFGCFVLRVPPLAARRDEIISIARQALADASAEYGTVTPELSRPVRDALLVAPWPGNLRELVSVCRYMALHAAGTGPVTLSHLPPDFAPARRKRSGQRVTVAEMQETVAGNGGNRTKAAKELGISREHLQRKLGRK